MPVAKMNMRKPKVTVLVGKNIPGRRTKRLATNVWTTGRGAPDIGKPPPERQCTNLYKGWRRCESWALPGTDKCVVHTVFPMHATKASRPRGRLS